MINKQLNEIKDTIEQTKKDIEKLYAKPLPSVLEQFYQKQTDIEKQIKTITDNVYKNQNLAQHLQNYKTPTSIVNENLLQMHNAQLTIQETINKYNKYINNNIYDILKQMDITYDITKNITEQLDDLNKKNPK